MRSLKRTYAAQLVSAATTDSWLLRRSDKAPHTPLLGWPLADAEDALPPPCAVRDGRRSGGMPVRGPGWRLVNSGLCNFREAPSMYRVNVPSRFTASRKADGAVGERWMYAK